MSMYHQLPVKPSMTVAPVCHHWLTLQVNPAEELLARWTRCRLSGERLTPPCVADELGSLFNKESLVHALLNKTMPAALAHITSLKNVVNLKLDPVPRAASSSAAGPGPSSSRNGISSADFQCPVTGLEMNGRFAFVIHRPSGVALSERAIREVPAACEELLGGKWTADDLIPVNPQGEELEKRQQQVLAAVVAEKARKKAKKAEKHKADKAAVTAADGLVDGTTAGDAGSKAAGAAVVAVVGSKRPSAGPAVAAATAAVDTVVAKKLKLPPGATSDVYKSIFSTGQPHVKETFLCRSTAGRGLGM